MLALAITNGAYDEQALEQAPYPQWVRRLASREGLLHPDPLKRLPLPQLLAAVGGLGGVQSSEFLGGADTCKEAAEPADSKMNIHMHALGDSEPPGAEGEPSASAAAEAAATATRDKDLDLLDTIVAATARRRSLDRVLDQFDATGSV